MKRIAMRPFGRAEYKIYKTIMEALKHDCPLSRGGEAMVALHYYLLRYSAAYRMMSAKVQEALLKEYLQIFKKVT